mmetsp:Transcript_8867/g.18565  ORF Transcript_8867/g.18565 Transcript_8867/m.18565 type:complete len:170 (-) Transcript_8867:2313-2822(-)
MDDLSSSGAAVMYGREFQKKAHIHNTGVMLMDVDKFENELPEIVKLLGSKGKPNGFDQGLLNNYFSLAGNELKRTLLPIYYNWKAYWKVEPSAFHEVKIVHSHGPKVGTGMDIIASCEFQKIEEMGTTQKNVYHPLIKEGICCDKGRTAAWFVDSFQRLLPLPEDICEE